MSRDLEERIERLEDTEEIKKLKARSCYYFDGAQIDELAELFAEDAVLDLRPLLPEKIVGNREIAKFFGDNIAVMQRHHVANPVIEIEGKKAKGTWYVLGTATFAGPGGDEATWLQGRYEDEYVKVGKKWKFSLLKYDLNIRCPYQEGWVKKNQ